MQLNLISRFKNVNVSMSYGHFMLVVALLLVTLFNGQFLYKTYSATTATGEPINYVFLLSVPFLLTALSIIVISWLSLVTFAKQLAIASVLVSSVLFYASLNYGVIFDKSMMQNIIETNTGEAFSYLNLDLLLYVVMLGILPSLLLYKIKITGSFTQRLKSFVWVNCVAVLVCIVTAVPFYKDYAAVGRNNRDLTSYITPFAFYTAGYKYLRDNYFYPPLPFTVLDSSPFQAHPQKSVLTVVVVGETARAQNFSLHGYEHPTNRYTSKMGVKYFNNVSSCGTATAISVPCMFSRLGHDNYDARTASAQENVLDIVQRSGVSVTWIDNNSSCKGVCARVHNETVDPSIKSDLCDGDYCFDQVLVERLKQALAQPGAQQRLVVLHMIGSHGPTYYRRYPTDKGFFQPDCPKSDIQNCSHQELVNTYDNTIAYTDFILSQLIDVTASTDFEQKNVLYVSDHGESLGEKGLYLHGFPYSLAPQEQTRIPLIYWSNELADADFAKCVSERSSEALSHDNIFDTILGLSSVKSSLYQANLDMFHGCKRVTI
ncbi:phosphoethanolamine transferase [Pseudoalteromonas sp. GB56]